MWHPLGKLTKTATAALFLSAISVSLLLALDFMLIYNNFENVC